MVESSSKPSVELVVLWPVRVGTVGSTSIKGENIVAKNDSLRGEPARDEMYNSISKFFTALTELIHVFKKKLEEEQK